MIRFLFASILSAHAILIPARSLPLMPKEQVRDHALRSGRLAYADLERTRFFRASYEKRGWRYLFDVPSQFPAVLVETEGREPLVYVWLDEGRREVKPGEWKARVKVGPHVVLKTKGGEWRRLRPSDGCEWVASHLQDTKTLREFAAASHQDP